MINVLKIGQTSSTDQMKN